MKVNFIAAIMFLSELSLLLWLTILFVAIDKLQGEIDSIEMLIEWLFFQKIGGALRRYCMLLWFLSNIRLMIGQLL